MIGWISIDYLYCVCVCDIGRFARRQVHEFKHCIQTQTISLYFKTILLQKMILLKTFFLNKILLPKKNFWIWKNFELTNFSYRNVASKKKQTKWYLTLYNDYMIFFDQFSKLKNFTKWWHFYYSLELFIIW